MSEKQLINEARALLGTSVHIEDRGPLYHSPADRVEVGRVVYGGAFEVLGTGPTIREALAAARDQVHRESSTRIQ